jgi:hypothetical protein
MGRHGLVKPLHLPTGRAAPTKLTYVDVRAAALTGEHVSDDLLGTNSVELGLSEPLDR